MPRRRWTCCGFGCRAAGLEAPRRELVATAPELTDRVGRITDWQQVSLLSVQADRWPVGYRPGLLLIGDAAHVMSPAGGNGINYAVNDAVNEHTLCNQYGRARPRSTF